MKQKPNKMKPNTAELRAMVPPLALSVAEQVYQDVQDWINEPVVGPRIGGEIIFPQTPDKLRWIAQAPWYFVPFVGWVISKVPTRGFALEIGLARGGTHYMLTQLFEHTISVELDVTLVGRYAITNSMDRDTIICGSSTDEATVAVLRELLDGIELDFLLIDGDHHYPAAESDLMNYYPLVRPGGVCALDDYRSHGSIRKLVHAARRGLIEGIEIPEPTLFGQIVCWQKPE